MDRQVSCIRGRTSDRTAGAGQGAQALAELLGERMSPWEACEAGLVNRVVPEEEFEGAVRDWAEKLASKSPLIMKLGKDAMYRQLDMPFEDALDFLRAQLSLSFTTEDIQEGVKAFFEKRDPVWTGR